MFTDQCVSGDQHQGDLKQLDAPHEERLLVFVGELPSGRRKKKEWQDKKGRGHVRELRVIHAGDHHTLKCDQDNQTIAKHVVVEGAEKLGDEKWREAALPQERELAGI